ncbi:MAG: T9SS type A sorting domain-containing protein [Bacteroidota bacterium]
MYNANGQAVLDQNCLGIKTLSIEQLPIGMYMVEMKGSAGIKRQKLIKQ